MTINCIPIDPVDNVDHEGGINVMEKAWIWISPSVREGKVVPEKYVFFTYHYFHHDLSSRNYVNLEPLNEIHFYYR